MLISKTDTDIGIRKKTFISGSAITSQSAFSSKLGGKLNKCFILFVI